MKVSYELITAVLAASVVAHPQNSKKPSSTTTSVSATSSSAVPSKGVMGSVPFMPTWLFRDSPETKCINTWRNCSSSKSSDQMACASDLAACVKANVSSAISSATSTKSATSTTVSLTASSTVARIGKPSGLLAWWSQEQSRRHCRFDHYTCIKDKSKDKSTCDDVRSSCLDSAKSAAATATATSATGSNSIARSSATTTGTDSTSTASATASSSSSVPEATGTAALSEDDPAFNDDNSDDSS
ncbi:hypothetical protein ACLX1H_000961 [Fusarium chlamydosporum]